MIYFVKLFSLLLVACSLFYFVPAAYADTNCEGRIVNDSSGTAVVYISNASSGDGIFSVYEITQGVDCTALSNAAGAFSCIILNGNAGLTFRFTHTHDNMKAFFHIEFNGQASPKTELGGSIDSPPLHPVCNQGDLQLSNPVCVAGVCAGNIPGTNNIKIYDQKS